MKLKEKYLDEVIRESKATRNLLALVPMEKGDFKPHEKSMSLSQLARHVAEIPGWWKECLLQDELDFAKGEYVPKKVENLEALLSLHDEVIENAKKILTEVDDSEFSKNWTMRNGELIFFTLTKDEVVRTWCLNHLYHHRAQLCVYLRMLDIALPSIYGPTADLQNM
ncbi:MAG: DinB family protein [Flavobacteriia bacterium]|nr:DinB family protein [Flavobacteriia bacterium]